jgi:hypothetical protein
MRPEIQVLWTFAVFTRGEFVESDTPAGGQF